MSKHYFKAMHTILHHQINLSKIQQIIDSQLLPQNRKFTVKFVRSILKIYSSVFFNQITAYNSEQVILSEQSLCELQKKPHKLQHTRFLCQGLNIVEKRLQVVYKYIPVIIVVNVNNIDINSNNDDFFLYNDEMVQTQLTINNKLRHMRKTIFESKTARFIK
eukprot:TRINITY_DN5081_c0_g1_i1.p4 TRINITY_DN5081_c0_g1~~TRINITY_DN5081_c0_g1_i1.p4  ORF type:complete len:162 (+),score=2.14 TRINITY_DN5081_c0_g1_i1:661-1146(+)